MLVFYKINEDGTASEGTGKKVPAGYKKFNRGKEPGELISARKVLATSGQKKAKGEVYTLNDVDYRVPFTEAMALCLLQVKAGFEMGLTETVITMKEYDLKIPITATEFVAFSEWFAEKRNSFFTL